MDQKNRKDPWTRVKSQSDMPMVPDGEPAEARLYIIVTRNGAVHAGHPFYRSGARPCWACPGQYVNWDETAAYVPLDIPGDVVEDIVSNEYGAYSLVGRTYRHDKNMADRKEDRA